MPQPIDPNTEVLRANLAERIQQVADRASLAAQARSAARAAADRNAAESQVHHTDPKGSEVEEEARRRNPFAGRRHKGKKDGGPPEDRKTASPDGEEHELDVTI